MSKFIDPEDLTGSVTMSLTRYHKLVSDAQAVERTNEIEQILHDVEQKNMILSDGIKYLINLISMIAPNGYITNHMGTMIRPEEDLKQIGIQADYQMSKTGQGKTIELYIKI